MLSTDKKQIVVHNGLNRIPRIWFVLYTRYPYFEAATVELPLFHSARWMTMTISTGTSGALTTLDPWGLHLVTPVLPPLCASEMADSVQRNPSSS